MAYIDRFRQLERGRDTLPTWLAASTLETRIIDAWATGAPNFLGALHVLHKKKLTCFQQQKKKGCTLTPMDKSMAPYMVYNRSYHNDKKTV